MYKLYQNMKYHSIILDSSVVWYCSSVAYIQTRRSLQFGRWLGFTGYITGTCTLPHMILLRSTVYLSVVLAYTAVAPHIPSLEPTTCASPAICGGFL